MTIKNMVEGEKNIQQQEGVVREEYNETKEEQKRIIELDYNFGIKRFRAANPEVIILDSEEDYDDHAYRVPEDKVPDANMPVYSGAYYDRVTIICPPNYEPIISSEDHRFTEEMERKAYPSAAEDKK
jgi:hypothetical protein